MGDLDWLGRTPNEDLEWALDKLDPGEFKRPPGMNVEEVAKAHSIHQDYKDAYELVKERLKQARLDAKFYRRHFKEDLPIGDCICDHCSEERSQTTRQGGPTQEGSPR